MTRDEQRKYYSEEWESIELAQRAGRSGWRTTVPAPDFVEFVDWLDATGTKGRALDLGCGGGRHAVLLAQRGLDVDGIDFAAGAIKKAKINANEAGVGDKCHFVVGDALNLPYPDGEFDIINDDGCFHHIDPSDWDSYLTGVARVLKQTGVLRLKVFSERGSYLGKFASSKSQQWVMLPNSNFTYFFGGDELRSLLSKHFEVESLDEKAHTEADDKLFYFVICRKL